MKDIIVIERAPFAINGGVINKHPQGGVPPSVSGFELHVVTSLNRMQASPGALAPAMPE